MSKSKNNLAPFFVERNLKISKHQTVPNLDTGNLIYRDDIIINFRAAFLLCYPHNFPYLSEKPNITTGK